MNDLINRTYEHRLSNGIFVEQRLFSATRAVLFDTHEPEYPIATYGGTMLVIRFREKVFAITALHVLGDNDQPKFDVKDLWISSLNENKPHHFLRPKSALQFESNMQDAEDNLGLLKDILVIELETEQARIDAYIWDQGTIVDANPDDEVTIMGFIRDHSEILYVDNKSIAITQPALIQGYVDPWPDSNETWVRVTSHLQAKKRHTFEAQIGSGKGLSGAPVYNETQNGICGFVVRGGYDNIMGKFSTHFVSAGLLEESLQNYDGLPRERAFVTRVF